MKRTAGLTLMEVLVAMSLLSLLAVGILIALRVGLGALGKTNTRLIENRRVAGTERILEAQLGGFMPVVALCGQPANSQGPGTRIEFFQGEPQSMRFVSTYSLQQAWRGLPQILEYLVVPREEGGVRLVVNEHLYSGPRSTGQFCLGAAPGAAPGMQTARFAAIEAGPGSFVLADKLAFCRFAYLTGTEAKQPEQWLPAWPGAGWPRGVRVEMAPLDDDSSRLRPVTITAPIRIHRSAEIQYADHYQ